MKKFLSVLLSAVLLATLVITDGTCSVAFGDDGDVLTADEWVESGIISPEEGDLMGSGYIEIKVDTTIEADSYAVYFDGEEVSSDSITYEDEYLIAEVYTVAVSSHQAYAVAVIGEDTYTTNTLTFYDSKKGLAMGSDMATTVEMSKLNISWYYNWDSQPFDNEQDAGVTGFAPMIWDASDENMEKIDGLRSEDNYLLGFNEPDITSQANMTYAEAIEVWPELMASGKRLVSPAMANPNGTSSWLDSFIEEIDADDDLEVDAIALHWYQSYVPTVSTIMSIVEKVYEKYQRPVWFTELAVVGYSLTYSDFRYENETSRAKVYAFLEELMAELDACEYVERYSWFSYDTDSTNDIDAACYSGASALFDYDTGTFTELGRMYSENGLPEDYEGYTISDDEMYVAEEETTTVSATTVSSTTEAASIAKAKIKSVKNNKKKSLKIKVEKLGGASKYQIQISLSKKFKAKKKFGTKTVTTKKTTYTFKKLKKKKKYYVRVRGVKGSTTGAWSKVKSKKVKK